MAQVTSLVQQSTGILFQVGQRIRGWGDGDDHKGSRGRTEPGEGILTEIDDSYDGQKQFTITAGIKLTKDWAYGYEILRAGHVTRIWFDTIELAAAPLDLSRPLAHRSGKPVEVVPTGDMERPFLANVSGMSLTFDQYGHFYPGHEQPIDLVNT